ncbi:MAG TPA: hypothetical protein VKT28_18110 [Puia sp.]|nr:hypothetical protein [Puia sp.]
MSKSPSKLKDEEIDKKIKALFKESKWKFKSFFAYKEINGFFFDVIVTTWSKTSSISATLFFKPLSVDDTFWEIVGLTENKKMPLSFRGEGAFTLPGIKISEYKLAIVEEKLLEDIKSLITVINNTLNDIVNKVKTLGDFIKYIEDKPDREHNLLYRDLLIVAYITNNDIKMAMRLVEKEIQNKSISRFQFGDKDFFDLAIDYSLMR